MPSMFESFRLMQMIAMRHSTVAVVRRPGVFAGTPSYLNDDAERAATQGMEPNGFSFEGTDFESLQRWWDG